MGMNPYSLLLLLTDFREKNNLQCINSLHQRVFTSMNVTARRISFNDLLSFKPIPLLLNCSDDVTVSQVTMAYLLGNMIIFFTDFPISVELKHEHVSVKWHGYLVCFLDTTKLNELK